MAINKKLLHFNEYQNFNSKKLSANSDNTQYTIGIEGQIYNGEDLDIKYQSIVFIKDTKQIWTHGQLYNSQNIDLSEYLTEEQIKALIPAKLSELSNDVGFITEANIDETIYQEIYNRIINTTDLENYYTKEEVDNLVINTPGSDYVKHEIFDPFKQSIEDSISDLYKNKQDRLENGEIILQADNTKIVDGTTSKTLAEFTKDYISLNIFGDMYSDLYGEDVVTDILDIESPTKGKAVKLDYDLVKTWKAGDSISIKLSFNDFQKSKLTSLDIKSLDAENLLFDDVQIAVEEITNEVFKTVILNRSLVSIQDGFAILGGNLPDNIEVRSILKQELKRTGIDIENGQITLDAATTVIRDGNTDKSLDTFITDQIDLSVYGDAIDELTEKVNATSLTLEQGALTINADETTIKDTELTLAQFTRDQASISVYDSIEETLGDNAVSNMIEKSFNKITYSINSEIKDNWAYKQDLKLIIKFAEHAKKFIDSLTVTSTFDKIELNNEDINKFVFKDIIWKGRRGQTGVLTLEAELKPEDIIPGLESLIEIVELRQTIKSGLKRTGIDIENGTITLQAGGTYVTTQDGQKTLATFTEDLISLQVQEGIYTEENGIDVVSNTSYNMATQSSTIILNRSTKTWKTGDVIEVLLEMESYSNLDPKLKLPSQFIPEEISLDNKKYNHEPKAFTVNQDITGTVSIQVDGKIKSVKVYRVLKYELKNTGIDIEKGTITLQANTTKIIDSEGEKTLAQFTKDQINLSVYDEAINELTGKVDETSLILENGQITLDANKTIIKDTDFTLASFTDDKISLQVCDLEESLNSTGIDIESGLITLNSDKTLITSGEKEIALFSTDENGKAFIRTELIDVENISANQLETKGTINEDNEKTNYINISNNSMIVYGDDEEPKTIIHSGTLVSVTDDSSQGFPYKQYATTLSKDQHSQSIVLTDPISTTFETNYSYLENLRITIARTHLEQGSAGTPADIILTPYLYTIGSDNKHNRFYTFSTYTIASNEMLLGSYSGSIKFSGRAPLQKGTTYYLALEVTKSHNNDGYTYTITISEDTQFVIKKILAVTEIASDGYNFNFSGHGYQNADQSGFVTTYGKYGLKIDQTGIFITKTATANTPEWINLFERLNIT